jgi:hypothetical protein
VQNFIAPRYPPMQADEDGDRPLLMSVKEFADGAATNGRRTPLEVADILEKAGQTAEGELAGLAAPAGTELASTLTDIRAMSWLGRYYADKIRGGVALATYQRTKDRAEYDRARTALQRASRDWQEYATLWSSQYVGQVLTRMNGAFVDVQAVQRFVDAESPPALAP